MNLYHNEIISSGSDMSEDSITKLKKLILDYSNENTTTLDNNNSKKKLEQTGRIDTLLFEILSKYPQYICVDTCIETGTYLGNSTERYSKFFLNVITIEIIPIIFKKAEKLLKNFNNIKQYLGDSTTLLPDLLLQESKKSLFFFLDAHSSSYEYTDTNKPNPLLNELEIINKYHPYNDIILIDDYRLFGKIKKKRCKKNRLG